MTNAVPYNYVPPSVSGYFASDPYNFGGPTSGKLGDAKFHPSYKTKVIQRTPEGDIVHWQVVIEDLRGGLNCTFGKFSSELVYESGDYDRILFSDADARFYRTLCLPQTTTSQSVNSAITPATGIHSANAFGKLHIALGGTAGHQLFAESGTPGTMTDLAFGPGTTQVTALARVAIGGASANESLIMGFASGPALVIDSSYSSTSMDSSTTNLWGAIQTFTNNNQLLLYAGTKILGLDSTVAVTTAPEVLLNNVPSGGYALGMAKLGGAPIRPTWVFPLNPGGSVVLSDTGFYGRVVQTSVEGTDYFEIPTGLKYVQSACISNDSAVIATDGQRLTINDGRSQPRDLMIIEDRVYAGANSNSWGANTVKIRGVAARGPEVWVEMVATGASVTRWFERYDTVHNSWHQTGLGKTLTSGDGTVLMAGSMPWSDATGWLVTYSGVNTHRFSAVFAPPYGSNPYTLGNTSTNALFTYDSPAVFLSPWWELPGLEGYPKLISRIDFLGDVDTSPGSTVGVYVTGGAHVDFISGLSRRAQLADLIDTGDIFYQLQFAVTLSATTAHTTPNALPILLEGYCFVKNLDPPYSFIDDQQR